jgi:hypothetical protein
MSNPTPLNPKTQVEQLLDKVKVTHQAVKRQMSLATSDLEVLYHLSNQQLLTKINAILTDEHGEKQQHALKQLLSDRWQDIKGTSQAYCAQPRDPLNQLCYALALHLSPLPEDLSECVDWTVGDGPYFILMPDLKACEDIALGTNIHQYRLHEFILSEDSQRFIPICSTIDYYFKSDSKKPIHMVFTEEQMYDNNVDKKSDPLLDSEIQQLTNHSGMTVRLMQNIAIFKDPKSNFFSRLSQFAKGLFAGSSHGGKGETYNAAAEANEAIVEFFDYWDSLPEELRQIYLKKVPNLGPILQRIKDPVEISKQGTDYCMGVTAGDLTHEISIHQQHLQTDDFNSLQKAIETLTTELEQAIQKPNYTLNPVKTDHKPLARQVMDIPVLEQQALIRNHLHLDYPNFLLYAFDQQPSLINSFVDGFKRSKFKGELLQQRASNGMSVLMIAAQSYPDLLDTLLEGSSELTTSQLKNELMSKTASGDSLPLIILQRRPQALPALFKAIEKLDEESQLEFINQLDKNQSSLLMMAMESNAEAFAQLCGLIGKFPSQLIAGLLGQTNSEGDTLLMMAMSHYPQAVTPLMVLFGKCTPNAQKKLVAPINKHGLNLPFLALDSEPGVLNTILQVAYSLPASQFKSLFTTLSPSGESFFLKACRSQPANFDKVLTLLDNFPDEEKSSQFLQVDSQGNHALLVAMLHQSKPSLTLVNALKKLPTPTLNRLLTTTNRDGFSPLTLALTQRPDYYESIVSLINDLSTDEQAVIWQQKSPNNWHLPFLSSIYSPEYLTSVMSHVKASSHFESLNQTDASGNGMLAFTASFHPEQLPELLTTVKGMSVEKRYQLVSNTNANGDNLITWVLQQDASRLDEIMPLMAGFSVDQQVKLLCQRNRQQQHALGIAYQQDAKLLDQLLKSLDGLNSGKLDDILAKLPTAIWFDFLSLACVNQTTFLGLYNKYKLLHQSNQNVLGELLAYKDASHSNLFMLILENNPSLVNHMIREVQSIPEEKIQGQIMSQKNTSGLSVLALAEKFAPDNIITKLQTYLKSLNKQSTNQMMLQTSMKMQSADVLISYELLESANAQTLFNKLGERDGLGNNLLGQIILRMPHRLPNLIEKMHLLLSPEQIRQLLAHQNNQELNLYWLALGQPQSAYLCQQLQEVITPYDTENRMTMLAPPAEQSMIEWALSHGKTPFITTMRWIETFSQEQRKSIIEDFWQHPSEQLRQAIANRDFNVCQRLISTTLTMPVNEVAALMSRNRQAMIDGLTSQDKPIQSLFSHWLNRLPADSRFDVLSHLSAEVVLSLLNDEQMSLIDTLPLENQASLFCLQDSVGQNVLVKAISDNKPCQQKLINRLIQLTPNQQGTIFQANNASTPLLHTLAKHNIPLLVTCLAQLGQLPSQTQLAILSQKDSEQKTLLDCLESSPDLYESLLSFYDNLCLSDQIHLFAQKAGPNDNGLLSRVPQAYRKRLFERFKSFPQSAQIEILLTINDNNRLGLKSFMQQSPSLQFELLAIIESFPKHIQGALCVGEEETSDSLIHWMLHSDNEALKKRAIQLLGGLTKTDITTLLKQKDPRNGNHLLQTLAQQSPQLFDQAFSVFMSLPVDSQVEILELQNASNFSLFADLVNLKRYDQFEMLCQTISTLPNADKVRLLSRSGIVPIEATTLWVSVFYGAPQSNHFIALMNNKAFYQPMFQLLQTLPAEHQITILTNRSQPGKSVIDEIVEPEQSKLRLVIKQAQALVEAKQLLNTMAATLRNEDVHTVEFNLHQSLLQRLDDYQNTYHKSMQHIHDLANGWAKDIAEAWPQMDDKMTYANALVGLLKLAACLLMPVYGAYKLYEKVTTNRHVLFQTDREATVYRLEDLAKAVKQSAEGQLAMS